MSDSHWFTKSETLEALECQVRAGEVERLEGSLPENNLPEGWKERFLDGRGYVQCFSPLRLKAGYQFRLFTYSRGYTGGKGRLFLVPERDKMQPVQAEPGQASLPGSVEDILSRLEGDHTPASYLRAMLLGRSIHQLAPFGTAAITNRATFSTSLPKCPRST